MKILHVLEAVGGGTALHLRTLATGQVQCGDLVAAAIPERRTWGFSDPDLISDLRAGEIDVQVVPLHSLPVHPRNARAARALYRYIEYATPDVVHSHSTTAGAFARPIARRLRIPTVHTPNGVRFAEDHIGPSWLAALALERSMAKFTDRVVAVSPSEAKVLERAYPRRAIALVPNGVADLGLDSPPIPNRPRIVTVNRLVYQKHPELAVRIMALVRRKRPHVEAVMVGDGPLASRVSSLIARLDPGIQLTRETATGRDALALATVVLLTSRWEGAPYVPLEAMSSGRPIVASDVVGSRDVVVDGETGFIFPDARPDIACERLIELIDNPENAGHMGRLGRERVTREYSIERMVAGLRRVYESILKLDSR